MLHLMNDCEHPLLYLLGTGIASQETTISGSCQQNLVGICNMSVVDYGMDSQVGQFLDCCSFSLCSELCLCNSFHVYFVPPSKKDSELLGNIHLSLSAYHVCSFVIGLFHSG